MKTRGQLWPPDLLHSAYLPFVKVKIMDVIWSYAFLLVRNFTLLQDRLWSYTWWSKAATEKHPPRVSAQGGEAPHQTLSLLLTKTTFTFSMKFFKKGWLYCGLGSDKAIILFVAFEAGKMRTQRGFWEEKQNTACNYLWGSIFIYLIMCFHYKISFLVISFFMVEKEIKQTDKQTNKKHTAFGVNSLGCISAERRKL